MKFENNDCTYRHCTRVDLCLLQASVFKARSAMLEKLKLECGFVQYPRNFIPLDCLHNMARENCEKYYGYGRHNISDRSFLGVYPSNGNTPSEPLESGYAMRNPTDTISTVRIIYYTLDIRY